MAGLISDSIALRQLKTPDYADTWVTATAFDAFKSQLD